MSDLNHDQKSPSRSLLPLVIDRVSPGLIMALGQEGVPFELREVSRLPGKFVLYDSRLIAAPSVEPGQCPIDVAALGAGCDDDPFATYWTNCHVGRICNPAIGAIESAGRIANPAYMNDCDPFEAMLDERSSPHRWKIGDLELREEIARVDRRAVRQQLMRPLRAALEQAGGVWLRVSAFPFPYRSAFNFRIDHDAYDAADFAATMDLVRTCQQAFSHYICACDYGSHPKALAQLQGLDVGSHGFWHHTYRNRADNLANIRRGIDTLRAAGLEPSGFVAPHGRFNRSLADVLETLGIRFSSEFAIGYDDLPFFPPGTNVLQIPVHPVCLGLFLEAARRDGNANQAASADLAAEYLQRVARAKHAAGEPIFLYGHPDGRLGRYPQVLRGVLETVSSLPAVWKTTYSEFADWWRVRRGVQLRLDRQRERFDEVGAASRAAPAPGPARLAGPTHGERFVLSADGIPDRYPIAVEIWRGNSVARLPLTERELTFSRESLSYEHAPSAALAEAVRIDQPEPFRQRLRRHLDWEKTTPPAEIRDRSWRGWAKWALRHVRR